MKRFLLVLAMLAFAPAVSATSTNVPVLVTTGPAIVVAIAADGTTYVGAKVVRGDAAILTELRAAASHGITDVSIACDKSRPYGEVIHVLDLCKQAGLTKISFAIAP